MNTDSENMIIAVGCAAAEYTKTEAARQEDLLLKRYDRDFVCRAKNLCAPGEEILHLLEKESSPDERFFLTGDLGVYDTLETMAEMYGCGLEADAFRIPVLSETVEVCELTGEDPFGLPSKGLAFLVTKRPFHWLDKMQEAGASPALIGRLTRKTAKIIRYGSRTRYLMKPSAKESSSAVEAGFNNL